MMKNRTIVYIDGFNFYFGLKEAVKQRNAPHSIYWLDYWKLAEKIVKDRELIAVKLFTARVKSQGKSERQNAWLNALKVFRPNIEIIYGRYLYKEVTCGQCGTRTDSLICSRCKSRTRIPEEKKSDVNIAVEMLTDAYEDKFDTAILLTRDSDLVPPINKIHSIPLSVPKKIGVGFLPGRLSKELKSVADFHFVIQHKNLEDSRLPYKVEKNNGEFLWIPESWKD